MKMGEIFPPARQKVATPSITLPPTDLEYGELLSEDHKFVYQPQTKNHVWDQTLPEPPPAHIVLTTYLGLIILSVVGRIRDFFGKIFKPQDYRHLQVQNGYAPLYDDYNDFVARRVKRRLDDCFARPSTGVPGRYLALLERTSHDFNKSYVYSGRTQQCLNMASYNYLGFARSDGLCTDAVERTVRSDGLSYASSQRDAGTSALLLQVEKQVASFLEKDSAILCAMGFQMNSSALPALVSEGCLVISDELNHASLRQGARISGATIRSFRHNDMRDLENVLQNALRLGYQPLQDRGRRPWRKILVVIEGIYSMEGTFANLPGILALKRKYKFYLFVDEAHSIGAVGPRGKGVCDFFGVSPSEVDVLMGTFSKSFGAVGGYIAASREVISKLRTSSADTCFSESPSPLILQQISSALNIITGAEGETRLQRLAFNSRYLRLGLKRLGFIVYGHEGSPIIPILICNTAKLAAFSHEMLKRNIATVVVAYPATPMELGRARLCVSAAHTKGDLDLVLEACDEIGDLLLLKMSSAGSPYKGIVSLLPSQAASSSFWKHLVSMRLKSKRRERWRLKDVLERGVSDVQFAFGVAVEAPLQYWQTYVPLGSGLAQTL